MIGFNYAPQRQRRAGWSVRSHFAAICAGLRKTRSESRGKTTTQQKELAQEAGSRRER